MPSTDAIHAAVVARAAELGMTAYAIARATDGAVNADTMAKYMRGGYAMGSDRLSHVLRVLGLCVRPCPSHRARAARSRAK
jgi:hypothetical protein